MAHLALLLPLLLLLLPHARTSLLLLVSPSVAAVALLAPDLDDDVDYDDDGGYPCPNLFVVKAKSVFVPRFWFLCDRPSSGGLLQLPLHLSAFEKLELFPGEKFHPRIVLFPS